MRQAFRFHGPMSFWEKILVYPLIAVGLFFMWLLVFIYDTLRRFKRIP